MFIRKIATFVAILVIAASPSLAAEARYIFMMIGDGMALEHVKAGGMYLHGEPGTLSWEGFPYRSDVTTDCVDGVTDSAAAATAIASGRRVSYGVVNLAIPGDGSELETILQHYQKQGMSTGLVVTAAILDATPAGFAAHAPSRGESAKIMQDYLTKTRPEVLFGGGGRGFCVETAQEAGYVIARDKYEMMSAVEARARRIAAIFGDDGHMPYEIDGLGDYPTLEQMTRAAIQTLEKNDNGFFVMVEGARIDHAGHSNDIERMVTELAAFDRAVQAVIEWAADRDDVLIVVTADHETGGLTVVENMGKGNLPKVEWATTRHTSAPVGVWAWGAGAERFAGLEDLTDIRSAVLGGQSEVEAETEALQQCEPAGTMN